MKISHRFFGGIPPAGELCPALKVCVLLLLLVVFQQRVIAQPGKQSPVITLSFTNADLPQILDAIGKQAGTSVNYSKADLEDIRIASFAVKNVSVRTALDELCKKAPIEYTLLSSTIAVRKKNSPSNQPTPRADNNGSFTLKGRVVDFETTVPLAGATIQLSGTSKTVISDEKGYYTISGISAGEFVLSVSYTGYSPFTELINIKNDQTHDVRMQTGATNTLGEVVIRSGGAGRKALTVTHATEKGLLMEIRNSQSVVSGISAQQISRTADRNAADVVRKIAGVTVRDDKFVVIRGLNERYNLTYLNDNIAPSTELYSRAFSLDLIPTRIIDRILVYKSPAPDLLADMTGGAIKIFTKDAKTVKHFDLELQTGYRQYTSFNKNFLTYQGGKFDFLGFDDGLRKLPSSVPGFGDFNKANIGQGVYAESFSDILTYGRKTAIPPIQLTANYYNTFKVGGRYLSLLSSLSYKYEQQHFDISRTQGNISYPDSLASTTLSRKSRESQNNETGQVSLLQNFTYAVGDSGKIWFKNFLLQQGQSSTILRNAGVNMWHRDGKWISSNDRELRDIILSWSQRFLYSGNVGGTHAVGKGGRQSISWNGGYTYSRLDVPDQRAIHLQNNLNFDPRFRSDANGYGDYEQNWVPVFRSEADFGMQGNEVELGMLSRVWIRNTEKVYNGSVDYSYQVKNWLTVKAGAYQQWKERTVFRRAYTLNEGDLPVSGYPDPYNPGIGSLVNGMDYTLVFFRQQDLDKVWSKTYLRDDASALKVFDRTSGSDAYTATEQNNSGYVVVDLRPFGSKLDIYGGIRAEYNRQKVAGAISPDGSNLGAGTVNLPVLADLKGLEWLPSVNLNYRPSNSLVVRGAFGKTLNRPEFRELSPYSELDYLTNQKIGGNSDLLFAKVNNYDVRFEWYPRGNAKGESISIGGFYKTMINPIERIIYRDLFFPGPALISFMNADEATVKGIEIDIRKNFDFINLKFFKDLSLVANGSLIESRARRAKRDPQRIDRIDPAIDRQLQGQAPYTVNAGLYYDNAAAGTKIAVIYNETGPRIYAASVGKPARQEGLVLNPGDQGSLIELERRQLDLSLTQRIIKTLQLKLSVQNLLDNPVRVAEDANFSFDYEKPSFIPRTIGSNTQPDIVKGDLLASDYRTGRYILFTLTYSF
jgi:outer membrane receptor protein involved in Fe transport